MRIVLGPPTPRNAQGLLAADDQQASHCEDDHTRLIAIANEYGRCMGDFCQQGLQTLQEEIVDRGDTIFAAIAIHLSLENGLLARKHEDKLWRANGMFSRVLASAEEVGLIDAATGAEGLKLNTRMIAAKHNLRQRMHWIDTKLNALSLTPPRSPRGARLHPGHAASEQRLEGEVQHLRMRSHAAELHWAAHISQEQRLEEEVQQLRVRLNEAQLHTPSAREQRLEGYPHVGDEQQLRVALREAEEDAHVYAEQMVYCSEAMDAALTEYHAEADIAKPRGALMRPRAC